MKRENWYLRKNLNQNCNLLDIKSVVKYISQKKRMTKYKRKIKNTEKLIKFIEIIK